MKDKVCLISGANSGIGKVMSLELARRGAHILMLCRNEEKAEQARREILDEIGEGQLEILLADLSKQKEVRGVIEKVRSKNTHVDVLINNAGFIGLPYRVVTEDGMESTFAVNHMAPFMLSLELFPLLEKSEQGRIVNVSSEAHRFVSFDSKDLQMEMGYSNFTAYNLSKLCNILFTLEFSRRLEQSPVTVNCFHPGGVATNFAKESSGFIHQVFKYARPFLLSPEKGAQTGIYLATDPDLSQTSGKYYIKTREKKPSRIARDRLFAKQLWDKSLEWGKVEDPFSKK